MKRSISVCADGIELVGELHYPTDRDGPLPTLCICHGIPSGNPPDPADGGYPELAERFAEEGFLSCIFNFRGAGESEGNLDMPGWTRDLGAVITYLSDLDEVDVSQIMLMGFSGGAAASACVTAVDHRVSAAVLCACPADFTGLIDTVPAGEMIAHHRRIGTIRDADFPPSAEAWIEGFRKISPFDWIDRISPRPLLIIHGEQDELIDVSHAVRLYEKAGEPKDIRIISGAGHRLRQEDRVVRTTLDWLKGILKC